MNKLYRSEKNKKIAGVIGGLAEYFNWDASLLRVITVILAIMTSVFPVLLIYIIWIFIVPSERDMK
ncbi:PspC domain-containing protein [Bacillus subtilis]|jgi:Putative stress-responsive transcriptional regulator|uniref:PspC domain-containing protein n=1 Tax=Bacillus TaxID=1386 RepID=UPI0002B403AF|nr:MULTISPECIES: PspC domain-containing protein [Bacillus]POO82597.1 PspC domain-containing protein [Bacillus sp. MBGLi97]AGE65112.1 putative regulator (stress mediated) [Bacillus subtilis XF-1]AGI30652.1 putative regulator (stress mediated) [Bacillus subtilis subsp. subtilis str. BAB-1]AKD36715.1 regulator (stress mediated) [Bacillus subtilis HJ5]AKI93674.1 membrane protein [Bacillus subtilis]